MFSTSTIQFDQVYYDDRKKLVAQQKTIDDLMIKVQVLQKKLKAKQKRSKSNKSPEKLGMDIHLDLDKKVRAKNYNIAD